MSGPEFFETRAGMKFYEGTVPGILHALRDVAEQLKRIADAMEQRAKAEKEAQQ